VAGVHPFVQQVHGFPFAGAINTGKQDDDREPVRLQQIELGIQQPFAQGREFQFVKLLGDFVAQLSRFKHVYPQNRLCMDYFYSILLCKSKAWLTLFLCPGY